MVAAGVNARPRHHNLAVGLQRDAVGYVMTRSNPHHQLAVTIKGRIKAAVRVVAHQGKVIVAIDIPFATVNDKASSRHQDLAVSLYRDAVGPVRTRSDRRRQLAVTTEGRIQTAVCVVAHQGKIFVRDTRHQNLAVMLQRDAVGFVPTRSERRRQLAVTIKGRIQTAVCVVAHQGKVMNGAISRHQNLAVRLQRDAVGLVHTRSDTKILPRRRQLAVTIKGRIQAAVCVVAH